MNEQASVTEHTIIERVLNGVEYLALAIEILAVSVIAVGVIYAVISFAVGRYGNQQLKGYDRQFRAQLGNSLLIGLEILVAADIIRTVALEPSLANVAVLGILVLVRTFLSWSLVVEIEGRWPWQVAGARVQQPSGSGGGEESIE